MTAGLREPLPIPDPTRPPMPNPQPDPNPGPRPVPQPGGRVARAAAADAPHEIPDPAIVGFDAIPAALAAGWRDFRCAPAFGLFFSAFYVAGGMVLAAFARASGQDWWLIPFILGFPLIAPFAAVGLYEISHRIENGQRNAWREVLGVVFAQKDRQVPSMAMAILLMFMFWVFVAHTIFALFMGAGALTNITTSAEMLVQPRGLSMLVIGTLIGAGFAAVLFAMTVAGLPLILDREVDFITAIIASFQAVAANKAVMLGWGLVIVAILGLSILPWFLGLFIGLPVLGHASWHMYRQLVPDWD
ncbi:DUF2189 domain-containing protein [Paracoccus sp. Z118]|uniref:DUF2189 domain-containing protein n=1 Tax=Paracoccus sp. Z118 TaxID=2851017 RepID=UPI001C2C489E|nr:DUF2189 domain-containing protein [Paracoccus sp. Z118]MBV0890674.1 DUF2189 domain-containing protein [Paracoccus sp. Z118]